MNFEPILNGWLAIGPRPKLKDLRSEKFSEVDTVITLLKPNEGADLIRASLAPGVSWYNFPFTLREASRSGDAVDRVQKAASCLVSQLKDKRIVYLHCSAGIHRTGTVTLTALLMVGLDFEDAKKTLKKLRTECVTNAVEEFFEIAGEAARKFRT